MARENLKMIALAQGKAQKRPKKILYLYLRLILCTETTSNKQTKTKIPKTITNNPENPGGRGKLDYQTSQIIRIKSPVFNQNPHKAYKELGQFGPFKGKTI